MGRSFLCSRLRNDDESDDDVDDDWSAMNWLSSEQVLTVLFLFTEQDADLCQDIDWQDHHP